MTKNQIKTEPHYAFFVISLALKLMIFLHSKIESRDFVILDGQKINKPDFSILKLVGHLKKLSIQQKIHIKICSLNIQIFSLCIFKFVLNVLFQFRVSLENRTNEFYDLKILFELQIIMNTK